MAIATRASRELGRIPTSRLLLRYSIPAIVGMVVLALYNVVDRLYIGHAVGRDGLAGFSLTFPPMMMMLAFGLLIGIGTATRISIAMGQGKRAVARCYLGQAVCLYLILSFIIFPLCALFIDPLLVATGGTTASIPYARSYLRVIFFGAITQYCSFGLNHTIRAEGHPTKALITMLIGAIANIILDPFFIFDNVPLGFCQLPGLGLGVRGAAIATIVALSISALWVLLHFVRPKATLRLTFGYIKLYRSLLWPTLAIGLPPFMLNLLGSGIAAIYNTLFKYYAPTEEIANRDIASLGIIMTLQMLIGMPVFGIAQGMQPILGYNTGACQFDRVRSTLKQAAWAGGIFIFLATSCVILFRQEAFLLFCKKNIASDLLTFGPHALAIFFSGFFFVGYAVIISQYFQSVGRSGLAIFMSVSRQGLLLIPLMIILPIYMGSIGIWWAAPISDVISILMAIGFHIHELRRIAYL